LKLPSVREVAAKEHGLEDDERCECCEGGARAMAEAIRDALRESAKAHHADGGRFNSALWALNGFSKLIDQALGASEQGKGE